MNIELGEITTVLGQRNSGKSIFLANLMDQMNSYTNIDPLGEHMLDGAVSVQTPQEYKEAVENGNTRIHVHDPRALKEEQFNKYLGLFGQLKNTFLIIDEIQKIGKTSANYCPDILSDLIQIHSSHANCGIICATRQAKFLPTELWTETNNYIIYHYGKSRDAKIKQLPIAEEIKKKIHTVDPNSYQYLYISDKANEKARIMGKVDNPYD